ncbi:hypothetical protein [Acaryochloris marina]|uniref:Uncharacterized protein n=1 Tax=Acaryochloris marina (strain MBIC 11017) TaxID=329726 RepID=B0CCR8_ACAM1|nr:hypothetical protein [Acaryochloris marina]ABW29230.1 hypothetical protein AM1_4251 [Acaryochloris marina MBIC11017]
MDSNITQQKFVLKLLYWPYNGFNYLVPHKSAFDQIVRILPDEESRESFMVIHNLSLDELGEALKKPLERKKADLFCSLAKIVEFPFDEFYLRELNLQYFHSVIPTQLRTEKQVYDSISHLDLEKVGFPPPIGPPPKVFIDIDLFPLYGECLRSNYACMIKANKKAEANQDVKRLFQEIFDVQKRLSRLSRSESAVTGELCPSICKNCGKYQVFERGKGRGIPEFCDECKDDCLRVRNNGKRRKSNNGWKVAFDGSPRTCQSYRYRDTYSDSCQGARRQVNKDFICKSCFIAYQNQ